METQDYLDQLKQSLCQHLATDNVQLEIHYDIPVFILQKELVHEGLRFLKTSSAYGYTFLTTMCGIHFSELVEKEFAIMYQLHNMVNNKRIRIRTFMPRSNMSLPTITDLWPSANWMEREAYDFYGFDFTGHPNLKRILNMDEMNYFPMRKEYALEDGARTDKDDKYFGR